ncbi:MAG: tetratricopeptide repeat protein [Pyrinomonadaceae bacterium]
MRQKTVNALLPILLLAFGMDSVAAAQGRAVSGGTTMRQHTAGRIQAARAVAEGEAALARGEEAAARAAFRRALASEPNHLAAHTHLGVLIDRAGDLEEAERHFAAAARLAPRLASARNNYGAILLRQGRRVEAAIEFEASLKLDPSQSNALINLAQIRFAGGGAEGLRAARELFGRAHALAPDPEVARALVVIALRLGEKERATTAYRDYAAQLVGPLAASVSAPASRAELGAALLEAGLIEEARTELGAAVAGDPSGVDAVIALARAHLRKRDVPAAGRVLEAAVARGLDVAPIYAALADVYEAGGYVENAIPAMRLALQRAPRNETYHFRYGLLLTDSKAPAAAIIRLQESLAQFPRSARLRLALGIAQLTHGKNDDATASFSRAIELDPKLVPALAYLGAAHVERGEYAQAIAFYERAVVADEGQAAPYYLAADAMLKQSIFDAAKAEKYLERAVVLDPTLAPARLALAKLYVRAERWAEAALHLAEAVRLDPELAEAHYQLGRVYVRLKRPAEAQAALATFKRLSDTQKERREGERRELVRRLADVRF